jgi:transcriptional regulator with XRE-family HTH domain
VPRRSETYGDRLRRLRAERGLTLRQLSCPGVTAAYLSRLERGERTASVHATRLIADKLGVAWQHLETGDPYSEVVIDGASYDVPAPVADAFAELRRALEPV